MNKILNNILMQSGLIIPLDTDEIEQLARACSNFVKSESFSFSTFESLLIYYIKGKEWPKLNNFIENYVSENRERKSTYPTRVNHALVFFCIYLAIAECQDRKEQTIRSLALQNMMLVVHGKWKTLKYSNILCTLYFKSTVYLGDLSIGEKEYPCEFARSMFKDDFRVNEDIDDEMSECIQSLVLMAFDAEMEQFISKLDEKDPFMRVVSILEHYFLNMPQLPTLNDFKRLMSITFIDKEGKGQKISNILGKIADSGVVLSEEINSESSLILMGVNRLMNSENIDYLNKIRLKPKEFFVYLYHELLLEKFLK